jgi:hypothetical protein
MKSTVAILALLLPTNAFNISPSASRISTSLSARNQLDRRSAIQIATAGGIALSSLLTQDEALAIQDYDVKPKRILITGSNSGIGLDAAQRMALRGHEIVLACVSLSLYAFCWIYLLVFEVY